MSARFRLALALLAILLPLAALPIAARPAEAPARLDPAAATAPPASTVSAGAEDLSVPTTTTEAGPLFALAPIVARLGGQLDTGADGQSFTLTLEGTPLVIGVDSAAMTSGTEIEPLSQAPVAGENGVMVPLDFLQKSYGAIEGHLFRWDPGQRRLTVERRTGRSLPVIIDLVHLQGTSTVVLQFSDRPRYRIDRRGSEIAVEVQGDRLELAGERPKIEDPLVREVRLTADRVRIELAPNTSAESYSLEQPFRLVFDVHREAAAPERVESELRPPAPRPGVRLIVVDPGHGGSETGAIGKSGAEEKDLTLVLAQTLKRELESRLPVRVVLTRAEDANLPLDTRAAIANQNKADLFVSLHLNSSVGPGAHGAETFFLSMQASDQRAAKAAATENDPEGGAAPPDAAGGGAGSDGGDALYDLQLILWDLAQSHYLAESQRLASLIQEELNQTLDLRDRGVKQAPFRVLMGAAMPAVLVELGFLSNPEEEKQLEDPAYRSRLIDALVRAIARYKAQVEDRGPVAPAPSPGPP